MKRYLNKKIFKIATKLTAKRGKNGKEEKEKKKIVFFGFLFLTIILLFNLCEKI